MGKEDRRPIAARSTGWARALSAALARSSITPNQISVLSIFFAAGGAAALLYWPGIPGLIACAVGIQLRLICNLLDGMVAVEGGMGGPSGPIWNELPDRIADALFLVGAGYFASLAGFTLGAPLGWAAAVLAVLTAYVRELGRGLGFPADFSGPMAKPHRMAALTLTCAVAAFEPMWGWDGQSLILGLLLIVAGAAWTVLRRTRTLAARLAGREGA